MDKKNTIDSILSQIQDPAVRIVAEFALEKSRKALDMSQTSRLPFVVDEIHKIMPKALKVRGDNETS